VTNEKPSSWLLLLYDVPSEPSRLKVRIWREFKRMGALYPQMSLSLIPDNNENRKSIQKIDKMIAGNGKIVKIKGRGISETDQNDILKMFREERDKQYAEILEECQEFIDEINQNIDKKKTTPHEAEEMEESLEGLRRWFERIRSLDWVEKSVAVDKVENLLEECQQMMDKFTELSHPKKYNDVHSSK
jgi:DNA-directed RNA polymerase subunit L